MEKVFLVSAAIILGFALTCSATVHTVGDNSGWDISTDMDTWSRDKKFQVGDVLLFQYSSYYSVNEVTEPNYEGCNTTNVLQTSRNGNTSIPLNNPGDRYFVCGNRLFCLGEMKLHVHVPEDGAAAPAPAAEAGGSLPPGSTQNNNLPSSANFNRVGNVDFLFHAIFGLVLCFIWFGVM